MTVGTNSALARARIAGLFIIGSGLAVSTAGADTGEWAQTLDIYLLGPTIEGTSGIGPVDTDVDVDAGTVFDTLQGAFLAMYAAEKDSWGVFLDIVYMDLEGEIEAAGGMVTGELGNKQLTTAAAVTRRVSPNWQVMGGGMYTKVKLSLDTDGPLGGQQRRRSESWVDPFVGARFDTMLSERWGFGGFGYLGGFGVGSDLMWSLNTGFGYRFSEHNGITLMYRYIDFDYEDGAGLDRFKFDIAEHGPAVGWRVRF